MKGYLGEMGITTIVLVNTIMIALILVGLSIILVVGQNGAFQRKQQESNIMRNTGSNELTAGKVDELRGGYSNNLGSQQGEVQEYGDSSSQGSVTQSQISAINSHTALQSVNYIPASVNTTVTIPGANNGGLPDQVFSQNDGSNGKKSLGISGLTWYVLSADENGVNLVSSPTSSTVRFLDADGYDNCLYYLNEIATKLFANPAIGVTADRVHSLRLSDIKIAAENVNGSGYSFDTTFLETATQPSSFYTLAKSQTYTSNPKYPSIYTAIEGVVKANNQMYDEEIGGNGIPSSNDRVNSSTSASSLIVNSTACYYRNNATCKENLGNFGQSGIGENLFNSSGTNYWLASRCVRADTSYAGFSLRFVGSGCLYNNALASSDGGAYLHDQAIRVVVSVPGSRVNIGNDGTVTLK